MFEGGGGRRGVYSIGAVARMLDLHVATIRNWEERYAAIVPERSAGGHRLYSRDQVDELRFVAAQVARGLSAADAHRLLADRDDLGAPLPSDELGDPTHHRILIAERDAIAAEPVQLLLRDEGYEVDVVFAAEEAVERSLQRHPRLAIVELMISGGQGADLCRRLKQHGAGAVLAVSVLGPGDEALAAGADAFLQKPVDPLELNATIKDLVA